MVSDDVWKFDAHSVNKEWIDELKQEEEPAEKEPDGKEEELDGLLSEVWNVATNLNDIDEEAEENKPELQPELKPELKPDVEPFEPKVVQVVEKEVVEEEVGQEEFDLDELWDPFVEEAGDEQGDVCEWVPQYVAEDGHEPWMEEEMLVESWPPANIPVEYLDDEFFEEIYGSLDSTKPSEAAAGATTSKNGRRRRRRTSQKQQPPRRPKRPCSFFVEGECRRHDCKFSHDLGSITCRFWLESSCFKGIVFTAVHPFENDNFALPTGEECPFLHGLPPSKENERTRSCSADELSESYGSEEAEPHRRKEKGRKKFQFDLEADFPSLSQAADAKQRPVVTQSRPINITQGFAAADHTSAGSSLETGAEAAGGMKRRRKRFPCQRTSAVNVVS